MTDQPSEERFHFVFQALLDSLIAPESGQIAGEYPASEELLELYRANNWPDWSELYELSLDELISKMLGGLPEILGLAILHEPFKVEQIYDMLNRIAEIDYTHSACATSTRTRPISPISQYDMC